MKSFTDEQLVALFKTTHQSAYFNELYHRYGSRVAQHCRRYVFDKVEVDDLTQDIFLRLFFKLDTFSEQSRFSTWLYALTRNHCIDVRRFSQQRTNSLSQYVAEQAQSGYFAMAGEEGISPDEQDRLLNKALLSLHEWERQLLINKHQQGQSIESIAQEEKRTPSSIKMRLFRARQRLRQAYLSETGGV